MARDLITITLKGQAQAHSIFQGLARQFKPIALRPTFDWLENELTEAFRKVIGPGSPVYYKGGLWSGLSSQVSDDSLTFSEGAEHGPPVRRGTRGYQGGGRPGGYQRLKTWAESKFGAGPSARIAWFTLKKGTRSTKSATYPPGRPQYDYPLKVVEVDGKPALQRVADKLGEIVIRYVDSKQAGLG